MVEAVVEYDYKAEAEDELTIEVGEVITNIEQQEGGWWEGELNGKKGMFPDNFVKVIKSGGSSPNRNSASSPTTVEVEDEIENKVSQNVLKRAGSDKLKQKRAKVTYSYTPQNEDELELKLGDVVEVTKQEEPGWWEGMVDGKVGVFPSNFVELVGQKAGDKGQDVKTGNKDKEDEPIKEPKKEKPTSPTTSTDGPPGKKNIVGGMGFGNIFKNGQPKLRKTGNTLDRGTQPPPVLPSSQSPAEEKTIVLEGKKQLTARHTDHDSNSSFLGSLKRNVAPPPPVSDSAKKGKPVKKARVLYVYTPENPDELALNEGDIITIMSQDGGDEGWWKGENNGKVGVFPDNFVKILDDEPETHHVHFQHPDKPKKPPPPSKPKSAPDDKSSGPAGGKPVLPQLHNVPKKPENKRKAAPPVPMDKSDTSKHKEHVHHKEHSHHKEHGNHKNKQENNAVVTDDFDSVEASPDKLTHLTKFRAANPGRRPPSLHVKPGDKSPNDDEIPWNPDKKSVPKRPPIPDSLMNMNDQHNDADKRKLIKQSSTPHRQNSVISEGGESELMQDLRSEIRSLRNSIDTMKQDFKSEMNKLMQEIDEEKKQRMTMQVELDRLKRLVMK